MNVKKAKSDFALTAAKVVSQAIGEDLFTGAPTLRAQITDNEKHGRAGGLKGGKARAEKLSSAQKREIAKKAANSRWKK
jgi:hypothetical protein